jgi:hypothetical protein
MRFLGRKPQKKNNSNNKGNRMSRFAPALTAIARADPPPSRKDDNQKPKSEQ